ncbi:MAG: PilX N-terminal domain-containing pilus assembly protein [Rhodoferax sp.]|nr:PilX N-terminal domain-containing pilus assembly protein [Rhodoferax sp.]
MSGRRRTNQGGVVLIVALIMLMLLSILASMSIRGASSTEQIANQSRLKVLAQQTAEAALRFCEQQVQAHEADATTGFAPEAAPIGAGAKFSWETMSNWDAISSAVNPFVGTGTLKTVAFAAAGDAAAAGPAAAVTYFARQPECMSQYTTPANTKVFVTTARGFGPDVGAKDGNAPQGTEVWLQSLVTMK